MVGESIYANVRLRLTANRTYGLDSAALSVAQSVEKIVAALGKGT
ncbi:Uncharacterised protein [Aeromonas salmonicida]|nr:Uncharacterised protein [Aeromonas salmonicida]